MRTLELGRSAALIAGAIALLHGCNGVPTGAGSGVLPQGPPGGATHSHGGSWMDPDARQHDLLYVTNGNGVVNVYRYWQHTLAGVLTDFSQPEGECVDSADNVYVADYGAKKIYEYAHGGKTAINTIDASPYSPFGCAVNPKNGDLAVANSWARGTRGNIAIYRNAKGKPVIYTYPYISGFRSVAYDNKGNLLATDANNYSSSYYGAHFAYLPKNGIKLIYMRFCTNTSSCYGWWLYVDGIQWDGKYWVFNSYNYLLRWTIANNQSTYVDDIVLSGTYEDYLGPFWFYRKALKSPVTQVVGSTYFDSRGAVLYWKYPAGGNSIASVTKDLDAPFGVVGSLHQ